MGAGTGSLRGEWTLTARRMNIGEATEMVLRDATVAGYSSTATGPHSFRLERTVRVMVSTRTEAFTVSIVEQRDGVKVRVDGTIWQPLLAILQSRAFHEGSAAPLPRTNGTPSFAPTYQPEPSAAWTPPPLGVRGFDSVDSDRTVVSSRLPTPTVSTNATSNPPILRFGSGEQIHVGHGLVIGRDPQVDPSLPGAQHIKLDDLSLSRTHLSVGVDAAGNVWVVDRHSTNGASIVLPGTAPVTCIPGVRTAVPAGAAVVFGDRSFGVVR